MKKNSYIYQSQSSIKIKLLQMTQTVFKGASVTLVKIGEVSSRNIKQSLMCTSLRKLKVEGQYKHSELASACVFSNTSMLLRPGRQ